MFSATLHCKEKSGIDTTPAQFDTHFAVISGFKNLYKFTILDLEFIPSNGFFTICRGICFPIHFEYKIKSNTIWTWFRLQIYDGIFIQIFKTRYDGYVRVKPCTSGMHATWFQYQTLFYPALLVF